LGLQPQAPGARPLSSPKRDVRGLALHAEGAGGHLFDQGKVLLRGMARPRDRLTDLGHTRWLLGAGRADRSEVLPFLDCGDEGQR
jgi:hypothetical protein